MYLTKAEMEDIWRNKPVGYFSTYKKTLKVTKVYKIKVTPFVYSDLVSDTFTVRARNIADAQMAARQEWYTKYPDQGRPDGWRYNNVT